jgi:hypothetical protein
LQEAFGETQSARGLFGRDFRLDAEQENGDSDAGRCRVEEFFSIFSMVDAPILSRVEMDVDDRWAMLRFYRGLRIFSDG